MIRLIIADDHPIFIDGLKTVLMFEPDIKIIGEAQNGKQVLELLERCIADIALLDIRMPVLDGIETAKIVKSKYKKIKIIILTQFGDRGFIRKCNEIGVDGYLLKDCSKDELVDAIKIVYNEGTYYKIKGSIATNSKEKFEAKLLSKRENQVLHLLLKDKNCEEIGAELGLKTNTIRTYRERLMSKAGVKTIASLIHWAGSNDLL
ncbi:MAG: response regulator transcription factor [Bacteroidales bacterium]|nr:response regulator transcription factor [Bacteroidales bacterium]